MRVLARHCGVRESAIGHAGMKDRQAVTRQTVSVHLPGLPDPPVLEHPSMQVLWTRRHDGKLRPGQLRGNRFSIRVRQTDPLAAPRVLQAMRQLERVGAPNAYGVQRFGHRRNSHVLGALLATLALGLAQLWFAMRAFDRTLRMTHAEAREAARDDMPAARRQPRARVPWGLA